MLTAELEDWHNNFEDFDRRVPLVDAKGRKRTFDDLLASAPPDADTYITPELLDARHAEKEAAVVRLKQAIADARLDALIIVGDDQNEVFSDRLMPVFAVYYGDTILNRAKPGVDPSDWMDAAKRRRQEDSASRHYPVHAALAQQVIAGLRAHGFDPAVMHEIDPVDGEGHAFSYVHRYLMEKPVPIVPVFLNSFFPPNQPSAARCHALGKAIAAAVEAFPGDARIGIFASGGLSHFVLDEELDRSVIAALERRDEAFLTSIPEEALQSGNSEIRNWICVADALGSLKLDWLTYVPGYRTRALTGTGMCFARWG
jgi:3-O-methylgallate 3,4-dioxygenase